MAEYALLNQINSPEDVKALPAESLPALSKEIREFLVEKVTKNGGHLASNLGVVELTVALCRVFSTPFDHVIWDVSHQSYVYKMLTGRRDAFDTLRQGGGLGGFCRREESEHDCFGTGHSSTSLSAALGFATAEKQNGSDAFTVAVLGDGAFTGGMVHEALNNISDDLRLVLVINENEMSISRNIGRFAENLSRIRSSERYFLTKRATVKVLESVPLLGKVLLRALKAVKRFLKNSLYGSNYFEKMGLYYLGPVDGNDEKAVEEVLRVAREQKNSVVVHLKTKKGKGFAPAEENPDKYHALAPANAASLDETFSSVFGETLTKMAQADARIRAVTAAMCDGTGLSPMKKQFPERFFDVGIAEEHAVTFGAGMAAAGLRPYVAIYSTFLQRAYDQIIHDVALQHLPVCFCIDRAGLNPADGPTHHGIFDVAFLSSIPDVKIYTPATYDALRVALEQSAREEGPVAIRYPRGGEDEKIRAAFYPEKPDSIGIRTSFREGGSPEVVIITHGRMARMALDACEILEEKGIRAGVILCEYIKPYGALAKEILAAVPGSAKLWSLEEEVRAGGFGMNLSDALFAADTRRCAILAQDGFGRQTEPGNIYEELGLDAVTVAEKIKNGVA